MAGNREGAQKALKTTRERYGVDEDGRSILHKQIGSKGGKKKVAKGFAVNRELAREAGRRGGSVSRRTKAYKMQFEDLESADNFNKGKEATNARSDNTSKNMLRVRQGYDNLRSRLERQRSTKKTAGKS